MHRRDFARFSAMGLAALAVHSQAAAQTPEGSPAAQPGDPWVYGSLPAWLDADENPGEWTSLFEATSTNGIRMYISRNDTGSPQQVNLVAGELRDAAGNVVGTINDSFAMPYLVEPGALCIGLADFGDAPEAGDPAIPSNGVPGLNEEYRYQNIRVVETNIVEAQGVTGTVRNELPDPVSDVLILGLVLNDEEQRMEFWFSASGLEASLDQGEESAFEQPYELAAPAEHFVVAAVGRL